MREVKNGHWHIAITAHGDSWFMPVVCGGGINLPGNTEVRPPTCPSCLKSMESHV